MHDRHSFFGHALAFLLVFAGDEGDADEEPSGQEPTRGFIGRLARWAASAPSSHTGELVGVVAGVLVDAGES